MPKAHATFDLREHYSPTERVLLRVLWRELNTLREACDLPAYSEAEWRLLIARTMAALRRGEEA